MVLLNSWRQAPQLTKHKDFARGGVLLPIARAAISRALGIDAFAVQTDPWLLELGACFVTLKLNRDIRGCIGTLEAHRALVDDVQENAIAAAFRDPRFKPVTKRELARLRIEVSLLSPLMPLACLDELDACTRLIPGVHGVMLEYAGAHSTFLPQVWEELPDPGEFLANLKCKAGLPANFWSEQLKLRVYTVAKWAEPETE